METVIITDSCSDLPRSYIEENHIPTLGLSCSFKGVEYEDDFGRTLTYKSFYEGVRNGELPFTSQVNTYRFSEEFKKYIHKGKSIIYIGFSSALSGCVNSAILARESILEEYPEADITVIDTKSASLGEGLLVYYAYELLKDGRSKKEIVDWIEDNKLKMNHWFTVDDLNHLKRGGRVSSTAAALGTILNIKPILHVDAEGRLIPVMKTQGRKKSIRILADHLRERIVMPQEQVIAISHGDCLEEAEYLKKIILEEIKVKEVILNYVGPVIGTHSGPGTLALFFLGESR